MFQSRLQPVRSLSTIAFVKLKEGRLSSRPIAEQLQLISLGSSHENDDGAAFILVLQQYTRHTFGPLIRTTDAQVDYLEFNC